MKLEQAFKFFIDEELKKTSYSTASERMKKETANSNFTTDYRGKIIPFCPKIVKNKENLNYNVKVQTLLDSCRVEGGISMSKRGIRRDFSQGSSSKHL